PGPAHLPVDQGDHPGVDPPVQVAPGQVVVDALGHPGRECTLTPAPPVPTLRTGATANAGRHGDSHMNGHVQDELPALLGGELPPTVAAAVHAHLAGCDRCRVELAAVAFAAGELRSAARLPFADPAELPPLRLEPPVDEAPGPLDLSAGQRVGPGAVVVGAT